MFLSIDQGGHASRAIVYDRGGDVVAEAMRPVATMRSAGLRVEQDPEEMLASVRDAVDEAIRCANVPAAEIDAAGLATQRSSLVCMDRTTDETLTPVISWQDRRAADWLAAFAESADLVKARTGLPLSPHYGVSKLAWCLQHVPRARDASRQARLIAAPLATFLVHGLVKERPWLVDPANASRTLLMNLRTLDWDPRLLTLFGVAAADLPRITDTRDTFGELRSAPVPLRVVNGDQAAAIFAWGDPTPGTAFINMGTGAFIQAIAGDQPIPDPALLTSIVQAVDDQRLYVLEGTVNGAGSAVDQVRRELGLSDGALRAAAADWLSGLQPRLMYLNGIGGLGSPDWVPDLPSRFVGSGPPAERMVAVYESIVFLLLRNLDRMRQLLPVSRLVVSGGLAQLDGLCQRLADLSGNPVTRPENQEATALGTARLLGLRPQQPPAAQVFRPAANPDLKQRYQRWSAELQRHISDWVS
jgi:glycerol kinase